MCTKCGHQEPKVNPEFEIILQDRSGELYPEIIFELSHEATTPSRKSPEYIKWVQQSLNQLMSLNLPVNGKMGTPTRNAIRSFQKQQGLHVDGVVGPNTEKAIGKALGDKIVTTLRPPCEIVDEFDFNKDFLKPAHKAKILAIAQTIVNSQTTKIPIRIINITGHTDGVGSVEYNDRLGQTRAKKVADYLMLEVERLQPGLKKIINFTGPDSKGKTRPISNIPEKNRRVEICLLSIGASLNCVPAGPTDALPIEMQSLITAVKKTLDINNILSGIKALDPLGIITSAVTKLSDLTKIIIPTKGRFLDAMEQAEAMKIFKGSLDFCKIIITDGIGFNGAAYTLPVTFDYSTKYFIRQKTYVVIMLGDLCSWAYGLKRKGRLIHELTHAWQSQHHGCNPQAVVSNSLACQFYAGYLTVMSISTPPFNYQEFSEYSYTPGKAFREYAAEQIAQQVELCYLDPAVYQYPFIIDVIQSVQPNMRSLDNEASLNVTSVGKKNGR